MAFFLADFQDEESREKAAEFRTLLDDCIEVLDDNPGLYLCRDIGDSMRRRQETLDLLLDKGEFAITSRIVKEVMEL